MEELLNQGYLTITLVAFLLNSLLIISSIAIYRIWHGIPKNKVQVNQYQPIVLSDIWAVLSTLFCNVLVFVFGAFCFKEGYLVVQFQPETIDVIAVQLILLILVVDFAMFCFHKLAHAPFLYPVIHQKHHQHVGVNEVSLFVLSPLEATGFGGMLMGLLFLYPFHYKAVGLYLLINVIWGTIGHFNKVGSIAKKPWVSWLGTASFHNQHHLQPHANFGFYTTLWDRLSKTYQKNRVNNSNI